MTPGGALRGPILAALVALLALLAWPALARADARPPVAAAAPASAVARENALPGADPFALPLADGRAIEGYATRTSVLPGERLELHVSTVPAARYRVELYRIGWYGGAGGRLVACAPGCAADEQGAPRPVPAPDAETGEVDAGWPATDELRVPADAPSGYYVGRLVPTDGPALGTGGTVPVIVRPPADDRAQLLVQVPVNTWQAYNAWGGRSLYDYNSVGGMPASHVSFERPFAWTSFGSPALSEWELPLVRFLEREGYDVAYQTDQDTDADPGGLVRHRVVLTAGHGEYWTRGEWEAFEAARELGTSLAFMGANTAYWQVRYEDGGSTLVGYKSLDDPVTSILDRTTLFRNNGRFECSLLGVQHQGSLARGGMAPPDYRPTPEGLADPWLAGLGLDEATVLRGLVGPEWDTVPDGYLPAPCRELHVVPLFAYDGPPGPARAVRYTAASGARVFASGSHVFSWALDDRNRDPGVAVDWRLQELVRRMLADMARPAPPAWVRARQRGHVVRIRVDARLDPRVVRIVVARRPAADPAAPAIPVCSIDAVVPNAANRCTDRRPAAGAWVYEAAALDGVAISSPLAARPLVVAGPRPGGGGER